MLPLVLNSKWLAMAKAAEPLVLRNVYVQNQLIPLSQAAEVRYLSLHGDQFVIGLRITQLTVESVSKIHPSFLNRVVDVISEDMYWGIRPAHLVNRTQLAAGDEKPNLLLSHGYCAVVNPFLEKASVRRETI